MANLRGGSFSTYGEQNVNTGRGYQFNNSAFNGDTINIGVQGSNEEPRAQRKTGFLQALNSLPDYDTRKDRNTRPALGTCKWFLSHKLFQEWKDSEGSSLLWVSADPGCGKSVLAKHLIDSMSSIFNDTAVTVCYFFFKDDFEDQSDLAGALRCILYQIFMQNDQLVTDKLLQQFDVERQLLTTSFEKIWAMFKNTVCDANCGEIVCILDAVDECKEQQLPQLAAKLGEIIADNGAIRGSHLKVILTSRPYARIDHNLTRSMPLIHLSGESETEIREISGEIDLVIKDRVRTLVRTRNLYPQVEHLLLSKLLSVSNRTYLWAHLTLNMVEESDFNSGETIEATIARVTSRIPRTVDDAYERILANSSNREAATQLLQLVIAAVRPLTLWEMDIALHMIRGDTSSIMVDNVAKRTHHELQQYIRGLCGLFVTVIESKIYLLHQTAKEFLVQPPEDHKPRRQGKGNFTWKRSLETRPSHHTLSKSCIRHLFSLESEFTARSDEGESPSQLMERHVFLEYSAKHWAHHVRESTRKAQKEMIQDSLRLCQENSRLFERWFLVYWTQTLMRRPKQLNLLIVAAILGLEAVVTYLLKRGGIGPKREDSTYGRSALSWAAGNGFDPVVRVLISGTTVFSKAAYALLRKKGALMRSMDKHGVTPLSHAVLNGHQAVAETLINAGARLDAVDSQGGTPLLYAICRKQQGIIDLFTRQGAAGAVESAYDVRKTLLFSAARNGNETVVLMLLEATRNTGGIVTQGVLKAAAGKLGMETVDVLLAARKEGVKIDENVLDEAASNLDPRVLMLFLTHRDACRLTEKVAEIGARAKTPEAIAHILERGGESIITDKVIMTAVERRENGVLEFLANQLGTSPPGFQAAMAEMAGSKGHLDYYYLEVMEMLLKARGKPVSISEAVLVAAARNPFSCMMMKTILDMEDHPIPITERVLKAAAGNRRQGGNVLRLLYEAKGEPVVITNDVIVAALRTLLVSRQVAGDYVMILQLLGVLRVIMESQSHVSISKDVLSTATAVAGLDLRRSREYRRIALSFVDKLIAWEAVGKVTFTFEGGRSEALAVLKTLKDSVRHKRD